MEFGQVNYDLDAIRSHAEWISSEKSSHCIDASVSRYVVFRNDFRNEKYNL